MAKGDQENLMSDIEKQKKDAQTQNTGYMTGLNSRLGSASSIDPRTGKPIAGSGLLGQQESQLNAVTPLYNNFARTGGIGNDTREALGTGPGSISSNYRGDINNAQNMFGVSTGAMAVPDYSESNAGYRDIAKTGGIDPTQARDTFGRLQTGSGATNDIIGKLSDTSGLYGGVDKDINSLRNIDYSGVNKTINDLKNVDFGGVTQDINSLRNVDFSGVKNSIGKLNEFGKTGGVTDADKARINRPIFEEFEKTGGYTPEQLADIKRESNATVGANYTNLSDALARQKATSGGYGASFGAAQQKLARDAAVASGDQDLKTSIGLGDTVRAGRMDAAKTIASNQIDLNKITSPAMQAALLGAGGLESDITGQQGKNLAAAGDLGLGITGQQGANLGRAGDLGTTITGQQGTNIGRAGELGLGKTGQQISALQGAGDLSTKQGQLQLAAAQGDIGAQQAVAQGRLSGLGGLANNQTNMGQYGLSRAGLEGDNIRSILGAQGNLAGLSSGNVKDLQGMISQGRQYGTTGLSNLYQSTTNQISDADRNKLTAMGLNNDQITKLLALQQQGAGMAGSNQQMFGNIMKGVGTAAMFL